MIVTMDVCCKHAFRTECVLPSPSSDWAWAGVVGRWREDVGREEEGERGFDPWLNKGKAAAWPTHFRCWDTRGSEGGRWGGRDPGLQGQLDFSLPSLPLTPVTHHVQYIALTPGPSVLLRINLPSVLEVSAALLVQNSKDILVYSVHNGKSIQGSEYKRYNKHTNRIFAA